MSEDEHIKLVELGNSFWEKLGKLAAEHIAQMPKHLEEETTAYLQDKCSIYGTRYGEFTEYYRERQEQDDECYLPSLG